MHGGYTSASVNYRDCVSVTQPRFGDFRGFAKYTKLLLHALTIDQNITFSRRSVRFSFVVQ